MNADEPKRPTSKMQEILDGVTDAQKAGRTDIAIECLVEAIKLLAQAQQQTMGDIEHLNRYRGDIPIGAE